MNFPTREELMLMPLNRLRSTIDVKNKEEEMILQEVVSLKMGQTIPDTQIYRGDVPDIKTKEDEEKWQKIIDERTNALKPKVEVTADDSGIEIKIEAKKEELQKVQDEIKSLTKCESCDFVGKNANGLRLHAKKHQGQ